MRNKKSVLMTLNHNYGCFRVSAGIAPNGFGLGEVAEPNIELKNKTLKLKKNVK